MNPVPFVNLTNGIQAISGHSLNGYSFVRIQSTACEQKRWAFILDDLDANLLIHLALGHDCRIYDYGQRGIPRALWQGCEWVRYALERRWYGKTITPIVRGHNVSGYFNEQYNLLPKTTLNRLDYFGKFATGSTVQLTGVGNKTILDGQYQRYTQMLMEDCQ